MIRIIAGGKKHTSWAEEIISEYEKRLRKPYELKWEFYPEEKLEKLLEKWEFTGQDFVILTDERGKNISSPDFANLLNQNFINSKNITIIIGGAYGVSEEVRKNADFVWSFSNLVFPHQLFRAMLAEQIYRAQEINSGGNYHHE